MKRMPILILSLVAAGCMPLKYHDTPTEEISNLGRSYAVSLKLLADGGFDVVVANTGFRMAPDEMETRQEFLAIGRRRAANHCSGREVELIDAIKPSPNFAGLEMRFRCK